MVTRMVDRLPRLALALAVGFPAVLVALSLQVRPAWAVDETGLVVEENEPRTLVTFYEVFPAPSCFVGGPPLISVSNDFDNGTSSIAEVSVSVSVPGCGTLSGTGTEVAYTPNTGFTGTDEIQFSVDSGEDSPGSTDLFARWETDGDNVSSGQTQAVGFGSSRLGVTVGDPVEPEPEVTEEEEPEVEEEEPEEEVASPGQESQERVVRYQTRQTGTLIARRVSRFLSGGSALGGVRPPPQVASLVAGDLGALRLSENSVAIDFVDVVLGATDGEAGPLTGLGLWANGAVTWIDDSSPGAGFDALLGTAIVGADYRFGDNTLVGLTVSYENSDVEVGFLDGEADTQGIMVTAYGAHTMLDRALVFDALVGMGWSETDNERNNGAITGSYDSDRWMVGANATYNLPWEQWLFSGRLGYLFVSENGDAYTESTGAQVPGQEIDLGTLSVEGQAAYLFDFNLEPYLAVAWTQDLQSRTRGGVDANAGTDDRGAMTGRIGTNYYHGPLSAGVEVSHEFFRDDNDTTAANLNIRYQF